ncbi:pantoate--beta-alanine ligase [Alkalicoccus daliensis]|uniref:Pantothenate synthetase n=1 Tax=Alkalicoccus daliensis TaxID=745820 RepID=A0A1H0ASM2_9BACI|nr:pantoate--beta-alanine ligase [Alkalicoccus daliensis]SDN36538.1 pantoate--beta-alanine ligase [Alkalicoccus daliensis]
MKQIRTLQELNEYLSSEKQAGKTIGFVPTMGYLHEGHLQLAAQAVNKYDCVVMSIFVNPLQFGAGEDFETYPRDEQRDSRLAQNAGIDVLFIPEMEEMYPQKMTISLKVNEGADILCGKSRPGHFDGVATVVMKLFHMVEPDGAFFGQKDAQQVAVIKNMVRDFNMNIHIHTVPVVREKDGLAMSSRNIRLTAVERQEAPQIYQLLKDIVKMTEKNKTSVSSAEAKAYFQDHLHGKIDYVEILTFPDLLPPAPSYKGKLLAAAAVQYSQARLIDNIIWESGKDEQNV